MGTGTATSIEGPWRVEGPLGTETPRHRGVHRERPDGSPGRRGSPGIRFEMDFCDRENRGLRDPDLQRIETQRGRQTRSYPPLPSLPRDPIPLNDWFIRSNRALGGRRPDGGWVICARPAAPSPRRHGGTEGHGEGKPRGGPSSAFVRLLLTSIATSGRALLLSAGAPQVPRARSGREGCQLAEPRHSPLRELCVLRNLRVKARSSP